jgi:hypothetical protein
MSDELRQCRNTYSPHLCHPYYAKKYDGYCSDCVNAGVPELIDRVRELKAIVGELIDLADCDPREIGGVDQLVKARARRILENKT